MNFPLLSLASKPAYRWWIYGTVSTGTFISVLEQSATSIVIPRIAEDFGTDIPTVQWLAIGYMLCVSALMMPAGAIADMLGRRRVWIWGLVLFAAASLITSFSTNFGMVLSGKILMGVGACVAQANGMAMVARAFPDSERGRAAGLHMTVVGIGAVGGPVVGGGIDSLLDWRAIFVFIAAFSLLSALIATIVLQEDERESSTGRRSLGQLDWGGTVLSASFLLLVMVAITFANDLGWRSPVIYGGFFLSALVFAAFLLWEKRCPAPMLPLSLFSSVPFSLGAIARFLCFCASSATFFLMPFFLVSGLRMTTAEAALYLLPAAVAMSVFGPISGKIADRIGTRIPSTLGMVLAIVSMYLYSTITLDSSPIIVAVASAISGTGMSIFMAPNASVMLGTAGRERYGIVSAFLNLTRNGAHVVGIAVPTAVVVLVMGTMGYDADLSDTEKLKDIGLRVAYVSAMTKAFQISIGLMIVATILVAISPTDKSLSRQL